MTLATFRDLLRKIDDAAFAALLREIGEALYHREVMQWRVLADISDELLCRATRAFRQAHADVVSEELKRGFRPVRDPAPRPKVNPLTSANSVDNPPRSRRG